MEESCSDQFIDDQSDIEPESDNMRDELVDVIVDEIHDFSDTEEALLKDLKGVKN